MEFKYRKIASGFGRTGGEPHPRTQGNSRNAEKRGGLRRGAVAVSLTALMLPPVSASAEDLTVDNSRETISSEEVYGTIRVGGRDK
ncbi:MAG: hypothetical protein ABJI65_07775, partial [Tateyamaria sp.]